MAVIAAIIVAGGAGTRMGGGIPKQYQFLAREPVLLRSLKAFTGHAGISAVLPVIAEAHREHFGALKLPQKCMQPVTGGFTRQESVRLGLEALKELNPDYVLIHDAARPLVSREVIDRVLLALENHDAVIPAVAVTDTIKQNNAGQVNASLDRNTLVSVQTPQGFRYASILKLHQDATVTHHTDDASLAEAGGVGVRIVDGDSNNIKITTMQDMAIAHMLLAEAGETRVGMGFDAHRLVPHDAGTASARRTVLLCGAAIPSDFKLEGHSDADVGYHALVDAILGALGEGDIGIHFPPTDPKWRGADSSRFVLHVHHMLKQKRCSIGNIDITFICERPKIAPYRDEMTANIARLLDVPLHKVSVKATTTEKMGFTGRGEGIAAQVIATVKVPFDYGQ